MTELEKEELINSLKAIKVNSNVKKFGILIDYEDESFCNIIQFLFFDDKGELIRFFIEFHYYKDKEPFYTIECCENLEYGIITFQGLINLLFKDKNTLSKQDLKEILEAVNGD